MYYESRGGFPNCCWCADCEEGEGESDGRTKIVG